MFVRSASLFMPRQVGVGLLLGLLVQGWICRGENLAQNPGFEDGTTSGWFGFGSSIGAEAAAAHSGSYGGLVQDRTAT
jgi:hypothetical protein